MSRSKRVTFLVAVVALLAVPAVVTASHTFDDVEDSNTFHSEIDWLADAGVTKGCNPPANTLFCPDGNVTRGQMAAFMNRFAAYLGATDGVVSEADDAATVAGYSPGQLSGVAGNTTESGSTPLTSGTNQTVEEISVSAPVDGYLVLGANNSYDDNENTQIVQWMQVDDAVCDNGQFTDVDFSYGSTSANVRFTTISNNGIVAVSAGAHTVTLCAREFAGGANPNYFSPTITAVFSPFGAATVGVEDAPTASQPGSTNN